MAMAALADAATKSIFSFHKNIFKLFFFIYYKGGLVPMKSTLPIEEIH